MTKILFICHGNICRSPMAEFIMRDMAEKQNRESDFYIESAAVSSEELGNPVHYGTAKILTKMGIDFSRKRARKVTADDYENFDLLICMDNSNVYRLNRIVGEDTDGKIKLMMDFTSRGGEVADPWYTGNFDDTLRDITEGCEGILSIY